jgi:hypothetical protein
MVAKDKKKTTKAKTPKAKTYHASIQLNTTKAPYAVSGAFIAANKDYIKVRGEVGDDIGKIIMVPVFMVKVVYLTEDS